MVGFAAGLLDATVRAATVLILAGLGEVIAERAGVLNLGVEGMMLVGALGGVEQSRGEPDHQSSPPATGAAFSSAGPRSNETPTR